MFAVLFMATVWDSGCSGDFGSSCLLELPAADSGSSQMTPTQSAGQKGSVFCGGSWRCSAMQTPTLKAETSAVAEAVQSLWQWQ
mmetsp:Transcript_116927/g.233030  ORF Transcript_116927/g.233030 Transcript_116927/m.233030 type:complete len:84 (+) Transcript_116927:183-434(+)